METPALKYIYSLIKATCFLFIFPMLFACGAAIEPDGTVSISGTGSTGTSSVADQGSQGGNTAITGSGENSGPVSNAGSDKSVTMSTYIELDGSKSLDPDGDTITYKWTLASSPTGSTASLVNPNTVNPAFTSDVAGVYEFELTVSDGKIESASDSVYVSASVGNAAPVANAGTDQSVTTGSGVSLDGSKSTDFNNDTLTYSWTFSDTPIGSAASLDDSSASKPAFTADLTGTYKLELVVNDGQESSAADTVTITASVGNSAPVADAGGAQTTDNYNLVALDGSGSSDSNGDTLTYKWSVVSYPQGSSTPVLSNTASVTPTFTPAYTGTYVFSLSVNDGTEDSVADTVTITVSPLSAALSWTAPATNADGTQLTDLAGYKVSYGTSSGVYTKTRDIADSSATSYTISGLSKTTYYFVIQAYDLAGNESVKSTEVSKTF